MKKFIFYIFSLLFVMAVFSILSGADLKAGRAASDKTIIDYYLQLPD